ncbi:MAG: hypothetical protein ACJA04_000600 [Cellvibrionaceae bacterium]|jgi:hypothetical protein
MTKPKKGLLVLAGIYTFLFIFIGPKFFLYDVARDSRQGKYIHDQIDRFVWGGAPKWGATVVF